MSDANVRVMVSALTEAAEQSLEDVGDEMANLNVDGHAAAEGLDAASGEMSQSARRAMILRKALDEVGDEAVSTAVKAEFLQNALDDAGDEASEAAVKSQAAAGGFSNLSVTASGASFSLNLLSSAFYISLIPAILTALTVLAPLVVMLGAVAAGAIALAGAFGAIIGTGILAFGEERAAQNREELRQTERLIAQYERMQKSQGSLTAQQEDRLAQLREKKSELEDQQTATGALAGVVGDLKEELKPLIVDFGQEFIPLISEAVDAIPRVVREMLNAVGGTGQFREALRELGGIVADVLPTLVGLMFDLARAALPVFMDFVSFLQDNGSTALQDMKASVMELAPEMMELLDALVDMAPTLLEFGTNVGEILIPAITGLVNLADGFMEFINGMGEGFQNATIGAMLLAPIFLKIISIGSTLASVLGYEGLTGLLRVLAGRLASLIPSLGSLSGAFAGLKTMLGSLGSIIAGSTTALVGIGLAIGAIGVKILDMLGVFDLVAEGSQMLRDIIGGDVVDALFVLMSILTVGVFPLIASLGAALVELVQGDMSGAVDAFMQVWEIFGDAFQNIGDIIIGKIQGLVQWFVSGFNSIASTAGAFIAGVTDAFVGFFLDTLPNLAFDGMVSLISGVEVLLNRLHNIFTDIFNSILNLVASAVDLIQDRVIASVNQFLAGIDKVADTVKNVTGRDIGDVGRVEAIDTSNIASELQAQRRNTDFGQVNAQNRQQSEGVKRQINQTEVNVDVGGDLQSDPFSFSRGLADQVTREQRKNNGA